jgi:hypothetical protein
MIDNRLRPRAHLHFSEEVKSRFAYLGAFGIRLAHSEATIIRYESSKICLNIYHGRRSYEIALEIAPRRAPLKTYSVSEALRLISPGQARVYRHYAAHTAEGVAEGVRRLSILWHECLDAGLLDEKELFSRLDLQRQCLNRDYSLEIELRHARKEAELAWKQREFKKVAQLLLPLQAHLSPSELKKLKYATEHREPL